VHFFQHSQNIFASQLRPAKLCGPLTPKSFNT